jgi:hypothetical protein
LKGWWVGGKGRGLGLILGRELDLGRGLGPVMVRWFVGGLLEVRGVVEL